MKHVIWTDVTAQRWSLCVAVMRKQERSAGRIRLLNGCMAVFHPVWATVLLIAKPNVPASTPLVSLLFCWLMYRLYLSMGKREKFWRAAAHHGQRMLVETAERVAWHSKQLRELFEQT